jgi:hypothetical protein
MSLLNEEVPTSKQFEVYSHGLKPIPVAGEDAHYTYMRRFLDLGEFHIRVGENLVRVFTLKTMPTKLKEVLAMIHAIDWPCREDGFDRRVPLSRPDYVPEHFLDTGWMTSQHEYVVCLPNNFLHELQGKSVSNDTVKEGQ